MTKFKEIKLTIIGLLVWSSTAVYFFMPYFSDRELWDVRHIEVIAGVVTGLGLLIAPDRFISIFFDGLSKVFSRWLNKKK